MGELFLAKATIPDDCWRDIKGAVVEAKARAEGKDFATPNELFDSLPSMRPLSANTSFMRPAVAGEFYEGCNWGTTAKAEELEGSFKFSNEDYMRLPTLEWPTILTIYASAGETDALLELMKEFHDAASSNNSTDGD